MLLSVHLSVCLPFSDLSRLLDGSMQTSLLQMYLIGGSMLVYAHVQMLLASQYLVLISFLSVKQCFFCF